MGDNDDGATSEPWTDRWIVSGGNNGFPLYRSESIGLSPSENAGLEQCPAYIAGIPASLSDTVKSCADLVVELRFSVGEMPTHALAPGEQFIGRELARLDIDAAGKVVSCKVLETAGLVPPQLSRTCFIGAKQYTPRKDASGS